MIKKLFVSSIIGMSSLVYANINTVVSILPQKAFVEAIGGDKVNVSLMVKPGNSPHTYEPKPSQMKDISKADLYFSIGVEFEEVWLSKFQNQNKKMKIIHLDQGIHKIEMVNHHHSEHDEHDEHESLDPHIWTSPTNVKKIAKNIVEELIKQDSKNKSFYENNYNQFILKITKIDEKIKNILKETPKKSKFMVFHPSWGYFAKEYNLIQLPIEIEGKTPSSRNIIKIIKEAKKNKIKAILVNPEISDKIAKQIANELKIDIIKISPLNENYFENLQNLAKSIANK